MVGSSPKVLFLLHGGLVKMLRKISWTFNGILKDETGGEVLEYALIAGLISVAAIAVIGAFGTKVLARWGSVNSSM